MTASESVALYQFINVAVAEKLSALRTEDYFRERAGRANMTTAKQILKKSGKGQHPVPGDELLSARPHGETDGSSHDHDDLREILPIA
ncbi:MAG: toxin-antitoxin system HicB family antitoxin [Acidobacteriota bacterium]